MRFCGYDILPGKKKNLKIPVTEAEAIDILVICGKESGKTLVITAGVHGCEYVGIEAAKRLSEKIDPSGLQGNVILIPLLNADGFFEGRKQVVPKDGENLNRIFPGKKDGTISSQIAYSIEKNIYPYADFLIDLHSGDCNESLQPLVFCPDAGATEINTMAMEGAKVLSVPSCVKSKAKNGLYSWAVQQKIPALLIERGANGVWSEEEVMACMDDIFRIMSFLGIRETEYEAVEQIEINETVYEEAGANGFWYPNVTAGKQVQCGERLGLFQSYPDNTIVEIQARFDGYILYHTTSLGVKSGESLVAYGRP